MLILGVGRAWHESLISMREGNPWARRRINRVSRTTTKSTTTTAPPLISASTTWILIGYWYLFRCSALFCQLPYPEPNSAQLNSTTPPPCSERPIAIPFMNGKAKISNGLPIHGLKCTARGHQGKRKRGKNEKKARRPVWQGLYLSHSFPPPPFSLSLSSTLICQKKK